MLNVGKKSLYVLAIHAHKKRKTSLCISSFQAFIRASTYYMVLHLAAFTLLKSKLKMILISRESWKPASPGCMLERSMPQTPVVLWMCETRVSLHPPQWSQPWIPCKESSIVSNLDLAIMHFLTCYYFSNTAEILQKRWFVLTFCLFLWFLQDMLILRICRLLAWLSSSSVKHVQHCNKSDSSCSYNPWNATGKVYTDYSYLKFDVWLCCSKHMQPKLPAWLD